MKKIARILKKAIIAIATIACLSITVVSCTPEDIDNFAEGYRIGWDYYHSYYGKSCVSGKSSGRFI